MSDRKPYLAANWKMQKTLEETEDFLDRFLGDIGDLADKEIVICPPFTSLAAAVERSRRSPVKIAAQNMHDADSGAYTGEISASMLSAIGVEAVVLGHSERRALFAENDESLARKLVTALGADLQPILCIGESDEEREKGSTEDVLRRQLEADIEQVDDRDLSRIVIAYEPIWAIGTGKTASADQAEDAIAFVRSVVAERDQAAAAQVRILYGGSVKPGNAEELLGREEIDGALVGGASLEPADFLAICEAA